jgi:hypothetical protein
LTAPRDRGLQDPKKPDEPEDDGGGSPTGEHKPPSAGRAQVVLPLSAGQRLLGRHGGSSFLGMQAHKRKGLCPSDFNTVYLLCSALGCLVLGDL